MLDGFDADRECPAVNEMSVLNWAIPPNLYRLIGFVKAFNGSTWMVIKQIEQQRICER